MPITDVVADSKNGGSGGEEECEQPQKRLKISAWNGYVAINALNKNVSASLKSANRGSNTLKRVLSKGKLGILPSLPLDVLFEIFGHLRPFDVLRLARATKDLRRVLMHKSAICVWRSALSNVPGMPECPPDMSLPAFVNLAFDPHCHNCLTPNVQHVDWNLRIRLCVRCFKEVLFPADKLNDRRKKDKMILSCVPFGDWYWSNRNVQCCTIKAKEEFVKQLNAIGGDRSAFKSQRKADMKARRKHAVTCQIWSDLLTSQRASELERIRNDRSDAIYERLQALGYEEELQFLDTLERDSYTGIPDFVEFNDHPLVKQPRPFTERIWKNIEPGMVGYMEAVRAGRVNHERRNRQGLVADFWNEYRRRKPTYDLMPGLIELWEWDEIKRIIDLPMEATIDIHMFARIIPKLPEFIHNWRRERMLQLIDNNAMKIPGSTDYSAQMKQLQLATCVFKCDDESFSHLGGDEDYLWYPHFMHHSCNTVCPISSRPKDPETLWLEKHPALRLKKERYGRRWKKWSMDSLSFDVKASRIVRKILEVCGLDYKTVTVKELDERDPRLVCLKCSYGYRFDGERSFAVRTWRGAVTHCMRTHWGSTQIEWQRISDEDAIEARILEQKQTRTWENAPRPWRCAHCRYKPSDEGRMTMEVLRRHLNSEHNVWARWEGKDYYAALEFQLQSKTVNMVPKRL